MSYSQESPKFVVLKDASADGKCLLESRFSSEYDQLIRTRVQIVETAEGESRTEYADVLAICGKCHLPSLMVKVTQDVISETRCQSTVSSDGPTRDEQGNFVCPEI